MRIIRHVAANTRQALRDIREKLGEDAVILSSRRTAEGVEVTAGAEVGAEIGAEVGAEPQRGGAAGLDMAAERAGLAPAARDAEHGASASGPGAEPAEIVFLARQTFAELVDVGGSATRAATAAAPAATDSVGEELRVLRRLLETQLEKLAWNDLTRRLPAHAAMLGELTEIGIEREQAERIVRELPDATELAQARRLAFTTLAEQLAVTGERWPEHGGRVAFIGASGAGKTTSLAKVAVRWVLRYGARELALVAADSVRIGARDQLHSLGQLLGAVVHAPDSFAELPALIARLSSYRLVLIDTPGSSAHDPQFAARLKILGDSAPGLQSVLVLPASTQAGALEETVKRFAPAKPECALLTKLDEAASLGGALSVLMRTRLPLSYVSEGQRVPEDLRPARALELVSAAVRLAKMSTATAQEDLAHRRFGRTARASA